MRADKSRGRRNPGSTYRFRLSNSASPIEDDRASWATASSKHMLLGAPEPLSPTRTKFRFLKNRTRARMLNLDRSQEIIDGASITSISILNEDRENDIRTRLLPFRESIRLFCSSQSSSLHRTLTHGQWVSWKHVLSYLSSTSNIPVSSALKLQEPIAKSRSSEGPDGSALSFEDLCHLKPVKSSI